MNSLGLGGGNFLPEIGNQIYPYPIKFWIRTGKCEEYPCQKFGNSNHKLSIWESGNTNSQEGNNRKQEGNFEETRPNWAREVRRLISDMGQNNRMYGNVGFYIPEKREEREKEENI